MKQFKAINNLKFKTAQVLKQFKAKNNSKFKTANNSKLIQDSPNSTKLKIVQKSNILKTEANPITQNLKQIRKSKMIQKLSLLF